MIISYLPEDKPKKSVDIILVTGDIYIDHPSFGVAIIARVLTDAGYSVVIVSQPEYFNDNYLKELPEVSLFIGITSGNVDSVVANYSGMRNPRKSDSYCIDGNPFFENGLRRRPDRATIVYTSFFKKRYKDIPFVLGGLEASIRRFAHYDFVQQKIRKSILVDSKADILVYSMGEKAVLEIAQRIKNRESFFGIRGTEIKLKDLKELPEDFKFIELPDYNSIIEKKYNLIKATEIVEENMVFDKSMPLIQFQNPFYVLCFPNQPPLTESELDKIYSLPFKKDYPDYCERVPAYKMIKDSITSHRGCYGFCSFCAIHIHQGPTISCRSKNSIINEATILASKNNFKGTITDVGGPTANMYGTKCKIGWCKKPSCLFPEICPNLEIDSKKYIDILKKIKKINNINNVFVSSGLRHDLCLVKLKETEEIIKEFTSGHLKIAPEYTDDKILKLMRKPSNDKFKKFIDFFNKIKSKYNLKFYILPYIILSFPNSNNESTKKMALFLKNNNIKTFQYQDFTPVPGTMATAIFYAREDKEGNALKIREISIYNNPERDIIKKILKFK